MLTFFIKTPVKNEVLPGKSGRSADSSGAGPSGGAASRFLAEATLEFPSFALG